LGHVLNGIGVSPGVARGVAFVLTCGQRALAPRRSIAAEDVARERRRFDRAVAAAGAQLAALQQEVSRAGPTQADVLGAQALMLRDAGLRDRVLLLVEEERVNVEAALSQVIDGYTRTLGGVADAYLRERAADVRDVGRRLLAALVEREAPRGLAIPEGAIVVSEELLPSATARLQLGSAGAFVTERGGKFSHSSILARSLGTPAVAGVADASRAIRTGARLVVDGAAGVVLVDPEPSVEREYERLEEALRAGKVALREGVDRPAVTADGVAIALLANVNDPADVDAALRSGAAGVGLYRTDFQFSRRDAFPTEEEQRATLVRDAARLHPRSLVARLLDAGGDKVLPYFALPPARNPALALRGTRLLLRHLEVLKPQLRAFLRAAADHPLSILLPVVGGVEEVREARAVIRQVERDLSAEAVPFGRGVPVGAMIEVPSAALAARALAREVDFLSLGTNDLVQYVVAADREDEGAARYYDPLHPGVLRLLQLVAEAAASAGRELTLCGEMGGDPGSTALLLGLGLRAVSVAPGELLEVKDAIRRVDLRAAEAVARQALDLGSGADVAALLRAPG
jgi:phosphoenolpyruvate-protein phosphotransferase (PTS system enzyme I)